MPDAYALIITRQAQKEIAGLPKRIGEQVLRAIDRLLERYQAGERPQDIKPVQGRPATYRIDSGEYRILFEVREAPRRLRIFRVRHRRDAYRNL